MATEIEDLTEQALAIVHATFQKAGLELNMDQGKTEAVITHRGPSADSMRRRLFIDKLNPVLVVVTPSHVLSLAILCHPS